MTAQVDTVGGVVVVRNEAGQWRDTGRWRVVEEFRVGGSRWGANPDEELTRSSNISVTLGPHGGIFVLEYASDRVLVFSRNGEFVRSFGGSGEGPGELTGPMAMVWDGLDRLWVADWAGRYHVFDSAGTLRKTVRRVTRPVPRIVQPLLWEAAGTLVEEAAGEEAVQYLRVDTVGRLVDTVAVIPRPDLSRGFIHRRLRRDWKSANRVRALYTPRHIWSLAPDGTVWSATTDRLRLIRTNRSGDTIRIVETSHRTGGFDAADRALIAQGLREAGLSRGDVGLARPVIHAVHLLDDGHILVGIVERVGETSSVYDVFDPEGIFLGTMDLGFGMRSSSLPAIVGDTIVAVTPGTLDEPFLVRATIRRPR